MKKQILTLAFLMVFGLVAMADVDPVAIKARHEELIKKFGDVKFLEGKHCFKPFLNTLWSVYSLEKEISISARIKKAGKEKEVYTVLKCTGGKSAWSLEWFLKVIRGKSITTLGFKETYTRNERGHNYNFQINRDTSDPSVDWTCILSCVGTAGSCYECAQQYIQEENYIDLLRLCVLDGPCGGVYPCICNCIGNVE